MDNFVNEPPPFAPINRSLLATDEILDPVPPSLVLNIPVIDESFNLSASSVSYTHLTLPTKA